VGLYAVDRDDGSGLVVEGIDVWSFDDGRIAVKDAHCKSFPDRQGPSWTVAAQSRSFSIARRNPGPDAEGGDGWYCRDV